MSRQLAVAVTEFGVPSQTFIRRHVEDLLPGGTVVVADTIYPNAYSAVPLLVLDQVRPSVASRARRAIVRRAGFDVVPDGVVSARRYLLSHGVEVVLGQHLDSSLRWLDLARELGLRFFAHAHGYDVSMRLNDPKWRREYLRYNDAEGVITMSHTSREDLIALGIDASKVHVIHYGVDVPLEPVLRSARNQIRCLAVGRMVSKKGPILALDAFRRARAEYPNLHLDMVGDGPLLPAARQFVKCFSMETHVTLHGELPNAQVYRMMRDADIFVHHSVTAPNGNQEGLPVALLEAMACGLPVVSTRHAGIPEAVQEGESGYLVDEGDTPAMAESLSRLARDPDLRQSLGHAGWKRASESFSWTHERDRLLSLMGLTSRPLATTTI